MINEKINGIVRKKWSARYQLLQFLTSSITKCRGSCGSSVIKVSDHDRHVMSLSLVPLKTRRVGQRCTLNLSRAQTFSRWWGVVVRRGDLSSDVVLVT
ncbi:hypothetical protein TNCV_1820281 [Trichonephila clavipes]|nr:hypothetical protein TNCV_1820281 [Trichonephila clavipes]